MREFVPYDENELMFYRSLLLEGDRYTVSFDVQRFLDQTKQKQRSMKVIEAQIDQMNVRLRQAQKSRIELVVKRDSKNYYYYARQVTDQGSCHP